MSVKAEDIATLVEMFEASEWDELHVEVDGLHLFLSTNPNARLTTGIAAELPASPTPVSGTVALRVEAAQPALAKAEAAPAAGVVPSNWVAVTAPNLGTFYRSPKPGAVPFVEIGQSIDVDTEICLLEVMKLFTAVKSGVRGVVRQICVKDADMVEFGQTLYYVEPV